MTADFERSDRLKGILQVAYEMLEAASIIAYKYNRVADQLEIFAMPGVALREMMRGPTPERIFRWDGVDDPKKVPPELWLENSDEYRDYVARASGAIAANPGKGREDDFRSRELRVKYEGEGDFALAKVCLYKGVGQTLDPVGQLFFNFHKSDPSISTFTEELRSAIRYVATVVRELLIEELYHGLDGHRDTEDRRAGSLHLLRAIDDKLKPAAFATIESFRELPEELRSQLLEQLRTRVRREASSPAGRADDKSASQKLLAILSEPVVPPHQEVEADLSQEFRELVEEVLSGEMWRRVCHAGLSLVETYGGQADVILVLGETLGKRILPLRSPLEPAADLQWLDRETITGYCIQKGKVFVGNNVLQKSSDTFKQYFRNEFAKEPQLQYKSLMVVPVTVEGEVRALMRLMSTDEGCFLDKDTRAIQDLAFVASYALSVLDARQRQERISEGLSFFAEGQAVADRPSLEGLFRGALRVLGAKYAVYWTIDRSVGAGPVFGNGTVVHARPGAAVQYIAPTDGQFGVRPHGLTSEVLERCQRAQKDVIFCLHVLAERRRADEDFPEYVLQIFCRSREAWQSDAVRTPDGFHRTSYVSPLKSLNHPTADLGLCEATTSEYLHSQIGFAIKEKDSGHVMGVAWICFDDLHHLGWWERLYVSGLSNYLAQGMRATGLQLAIRSFRHMIPSACSNAALLLEEATTRPPAVLIDGRPPPATKDTAISTADDVLYMIAQKAAEVRVLLEPGAEERAFGTFEVGDVIRRAWAIATSLGTLSGAFESCQECDLPSEEVPYFKILYGDGLTPEDPVNGAAYTAVLNVLTNAVQHGDRPFRAWATRRVGTLRIILANGGQPIAEDPLLAPERAYRRETDHGVGLAIVKRILAKEGGHIRWLDKHAFGREYPEAPAALEDCVTFFEVEVPEASMEAGQWTNV
ncbi:MAG: GAF domain-containing protein [Candidatus Hydrogenedentes bacterium]|nr:GAF domain-containing protein [Candidatus Hydrogenedentota bacterium]